MTTLQGNRVHNAINIIFSMSITIMLLALVTLFVLEPTSNTAPGLVSQELKIMHYSQAD